MFQKGKSGNPHGRPKKGETLTDILYRTGDTEVEISPDKRLTRKEILIERLWVLALNGDMKAIQYIFDRIEGKPAETVELRGKVPKKIVFEVVDWDGRLQSGEDTENDR